MMGLMNQRDANVRVATKIRNLDPGEFGITDPAATYLLTPAFMGAERVVVSRVDPGRVRLCRMDAPARGPDVITEIAVVAAAGDFADPFREAGYYVIGDEGRA